MPSDPRTPRAPAHRRPTIDRRSALQALAAASLALGGCRWLQDATAPDPEPPPPPPPEPAWRADARAAAERGLTWLLASQRDDGTFGSATYGYLADGQSLTPFVLDALLDLPAAGLTLPRTAIEAALRGVLGSVDARGRIGFAKPTLDYPVYATGLALSCLGRLRPAGWEDAAAPLLAWLRTQQFTGQGGWRASPALGGFPMGWTEAPEPPHAGHVDLSMTRRALEGMRAAGVEPGDPAFRLAHRFVMRCRGTDGGFVYSPVEPQLNKGMRQGEGSLSYGSATCDGLLALRAVSPGDVAATPAADRPAPVTIALDRLVAMHRTDANPGVHGGPMEVFAEAMRGYYRAGSSRVFSAFRGPPGWREAMCGAVSAEQHDDGRWQNPSNLQKEDDPIVATAFALRALARALG
jgi:hypothetical protein